MASPGLSSPAKKASLRALMTRSLSESGSISAKVGIENPQGRVGLVATGEWCSLIYHRSTLAMLATNLSRENVSRANELSSRAADLPAASKWWNERSRTPTQAKSRLEWATRRKLREQ